MKHVYHNVNNLTAAQIDKVRTASKRSETENNAKFIKSCPLMLKFTLQRDSRKTQISAELPTCDPTHSDPK